MKHVQPQEFVSYLHPCNEFSIGYVPRKKVSKKEKQYDRDDANQWERHEIEAVSWWGKVENIRINMLCHDKILEQSKFPIIGLSIVDICHRSGKPRQKRGSRGLTKKASRRIRDAVVMLEQRYQGKLGFYTFTLPSIDKESLKIFISEKGGWAHLVRVFMQRLKRRLEKRGGDSAMAGCSEIQAKRYRRRGEIAPHLHLVFKCWEKKGKFYISANELREMWRDCVANHLSRCGLENIDIDAKASVDCQVIKKSAHNYIAKYLSKGGKIIREIADKEGEKYLCSGWSHISDKLKRFVKSQIVSLSEGELKAIFEKVDLVRRGWLEYLFPIKLRLGEEERICGYFGKKRKDTYKLDWVVYDRYMSQ